MTPLIFTPEWDRVDQQLLDAARRRGSTFTTLGEIEEAGGRPLLLEQIVTPEPEGGIVAPYRHFGKMTTLLWRFVYNVFCEGGYFLVKRPNWFEPHSVMLADVYEKPTGSDGTAFISVWARAGHRFLFPSLVFHGCS